MCLDCGCLDPINTHGNPEHFTSSDVSYLANLNEIPPNQVVRNISQTWAMSQLTLDQIANRYETLVISDIDNTLCRYSEAMLTIANIELGTSFTFSQWTTYEPKFGQDFKQLSEQIRENKTFWRALPPDTAAIEMLNKLSDDGFTVVIGSNRPPELADVTIQWLDTYGVKRAGQVLEGPSSKPSLIGSEPTILLDDNPAFWVQLQRPNLQIFSPRKPYTPEITFTNVRIYDSPTQVLEWMQISN